MTSSPTITGSQSTTSKTSTSSSSTHTTTSSTTTTSGTSTTSTTSVSTPPPTSPTTVPTSPSSSTPSSTTSSTSSIPSSTVVGSVPTITFTGTIADFASGTPVAIQDPSFEQTVLARRKRGNNKLAERQSSAQTAAQAAGWTVSRCGGSSCVFENYNAADGIWAFAANNGGTIYQDGLILTPGATYAFTLYWQATGGSSGTNLIGMSARLGAANSTDQDEASWPSTITPDIASYCTPNNDGTITCRLFIDCVQDPNVPMYNFVWYVDIIRVQELSGPTSTSTTQTPTATPTPTCSINPQSSGEVPTIGAVVNPSFEYADIVGGQLSIAGWTVDSCPGVCDIESCDGAEDGSYYFKSTTNVRLFQDITLNAYGFYRFDFWVKNTAGTVAFALGAPNTPFDPNCVTTSCQMEEWNTHGNTWFYEQIYTTMDATTLGTINSDGTINVRVWVYTQNTGIELDLFGATMLRPPPCPSYSLVTGPADGCGVVSPTSYFFNVDNPDQADNYAAAKSQCQAHCDAVAACQFWSIVDIGASTRCYFDTVPFNADTVQCSGSQSLVYEKLYCPPIDSALFFAIISDYDLTQDTSLNEVCSTLDALKASADAEEATAFDPSGSSNYQLGSSPHGSADRPQSWNGDALSRTEETDLTSLSHSIDSFGLDEGEHFEINGVSGTEHDAELEELAVSDKETLLREMFPGLKPFDITYTLKKSRYNFAKSVEELLNQVFLLEEPSSDGEPHVVPRGIEAFTQPSQQSRKQKSKRRKNNTAPRRSSSTPAPLAEKSTNTPSTPSSKWDQAKADVDFLTQRTYLPPKTIASTYHTHNASLPATIHALCSLPSITNPYISPTDPLLSTHAIDLAHAFPTLSPPHLRALVHLTHPSTASAHDLARALTATHPSPTSLTPHYARPTLSSSPPLSTNPPTTPPPLPRSRALALAASLSATHTTRLAQASTAHRASKSTPLMSAAAGYYASLGRDAASASQRYAAQAADALVDARAERAQIDLHGVGVRDAVRIATERVQRWWADGAAEWAREGKVPGEDGFRVVVGVGRHSEGGRGRLGPAVGGALVRGGWRVEVGEGVLVVRGRVRR
ncbi:hypothetical protein MMC17_006459 [Xylographa soralifera]|nr:hypothetical protein [Xylographa soralifera]